MGSKSNTLRRREVRRNIPRSRRSWRALLNRAQVLWGLALMLAFTLFVSLVAINSRAEPAYQPGQLVDRAQVARVDFEAVDEAAHERAREDAERKTPAIYERNTRFFEQAEQRLMSLPVRLGDYEDVDEVDSRLVETYGLTNEALAALQRYEEDGEPTEAWASLVRASMEELAQTAILSESDYDQEMADLAPSIRLRLAEDDYVSVFEGELASVGNRNEVRRKVQRVAARFPETLRPVVRQYLLTETVGEGEPTYRRHAQLTRDARMQAREAVEPEPEPYAEDDVLVSAGEVLDDHQYHLLKEHYRALPWRDRLMSHAGLVGLIVLIGFGLAGSVLALRPRIASNPMRGLTVLSLLLLTLLLAWIGRGLDPNMEAAAAVGSVMLAAVILSIAYDQRLAIAVAVLHGLLIGLALDLSVGMYVVAVTAAVVAVSQLREVRHRSTLIRVGVVSGLVVAAGIWAAGLAEGVLVPGMLASLTASSVWGFLSAVFVGFFVLGVLPYIERIFKVTTAMTLLELCDVNQPLLRRLAQVAPGTYNHSLQVGTLAEAGADAIGANGLLVRVGAYYHDIGKIHKPQYFVENQVGGRNRHEKLSPAMSLLIIVGHVKDGVEMAREYGLPPVLHHFIESHHGTTLVEYFYHAAKKGKVEAEQPEETEFRYPGPRPHTREAAILMLCDAVESATRAMPEPTSARIENLVHKLAMKRLMDGQFSQCELTLADLELMEQAITKTLCAIYHGRVAYPSAAPAEPPRLPRQEKERAVAG